MKKAESDRAVYLLRFRHSHGGTGCGSTHKPFPASRASFSNPSSTASPGAYFLYHQHQPCLAVGLAIPWNVLGFSVGKIIRRILMKSVLIAIAVRVAGLSSGCAQMDQLAKQYNPDNAKFPGLRPAETVESRAAERRQYDTEQAKRYAQQVEHARIDAASLRERELLVYGSLNRVRVAQGAQGKDELFDSQGYRAGGMTDEERDFIDWVEKPNSTVAEMKNTLMVREIKLIAEAKADAKNQRKYEKAEQAKFANQQAEYARIIKNQQAQYAAKLKADADALEAARIERRILLHGGGRGLLETVQFRFFFARESATAHNDQLAAAIDSHRLPSPIGKLGFGLG